MQLEINKLKEEIKLLKQTKYNLQEKKTKRLKETH